MSDERTKDGEVNFWLRISQATHEKRVAKMQEIVEANVKLDTALAHLNTLRGREYREYQERVVRPLSAQKKTLGAEMQALQLEVQSNRERVDEARGWLAKRVDNFENFFVKQAKRLLPAEKFEEIMTSAAAAHRLAKEATARTKEVGSAVDTIGAAPGMRERS